MVILFNVTTDEAVAVKQTIAKHGNIFVIGYCQVKLV